MAKRNDVMPQGNSESRLTRRNLLRGAGLVMAASAVPGPAGIAQPPGAVAVPLSAAAETPTTHSVMPELSAYMSGAATRPLPDEVAEKVKHHVLDTLAAMISGLDLPPGQVVTKFARALQADGATIVTLNTTCGPIEAALVNGMLAHSDETDDSHAPGHAHPGSVMVPASMAAGEYFHNDGSRFLRSVALGYDIGTRVTMAMGGLDFQMKTFRSSHSICGTFGAAAAAGCAAGLTAQQMHWLLDYASQQASGYTAWQRDTEHIEKAFVFAGITARNGVTAALLVHMGATGVDDVFSGPGNFFQAFAPQADTAGLIEKLGERYEVTRTNIKKWTVGSPIQAPLDAIELIRKQRPFETEQVKGVAVRVATSEANTVNNREIPNICLQHMVAVMLVDKTVSFRAAHDKARMQDPAVLEQRAKVKLVPDEELERLYPKRVAIVEITFGDGTTLSQRVEAVRGTAENPMGRDEIVEKSRDLIGPVLGAEKCKKLIESILAVENVKDLTELRPLMQRS